MSMEDLDLEYSVKRRQEAEVRAAELKRQQALEQDRRKEPIADAEELRAAVQGLAASWGLRPRKERKR